jgi:predicted nucleic acid-binding protein
MTRTIFADTQFWIALISENDALHLRACEMAESLFGESRIVTSEMVLTELLNALAGRGKHIRKAVCDAVDAIIDDEKTEVVPQDSDGFMEAFHYYKNREDKEWGLTDCSSFIIMERREITEALTHDHHFEQAGLVALLRDS